MTTSPFGSPPPAPPEPATVPVAQAATGGGRSKTLVLVLAGVVALAGGSGAAFLLLGAEPTDDLTAVAPPAASAAPTPTPTSSPTSAVARQVSAARNPFVPLVATPSAAVVSDAGATAVPTTAGPTGPGGGAVPSAPRTGAAPTSTSTSSPTGVPAGMDLLQSCFVVDDSVGAVDDALDPAAPLTPTAAGSAMGQPLVDLRAAAAQTTVTTLRPLISRAADEVDLLRASLVGGTERSALDRADYVAARDAVVEQCAILKDPLSDK